MTAEREVPTSAPGDDRVGTAADLAAWRERATRELVDLIEIESFSDHEHRVVEHLVRRCEELGVPARRLPVAGAADDLLIGWSERPELLLTAHVDTIRPTWPWSGRAEIRGDRVFGLGAQDDKGCVVAALVALQLARDAGVDLATLPVGVGLCVDEERGGKGSLAMADALRPRFVVGLEGTELGLGLAEGGFVEVWIHVRGRAVHGALRELGDNAIESAMELVRRIHAHPASTYTHPLLGRNIPMTWEIRGGEPLNVVPDACSVHVDWRVAPGGPSAAELFDSVCSIAAEVGAEVEAVEVVEPFETDRDAPLARALGEAVVRATGGSPAATGMVAWTDAHNFVDVAGSQAVVFGPGHLRDAHRPDEHVSVSDVLTCASVLAELLAAAPYLVGDRP
jgi:acetylornithine deacetylase/succinyl-diaminopimelate desuccinylase-like protein